MRRLSIRLRITLAFAGVMAILLAGLGLFIYLRFQDQLNETINNGLISRAKDVGTLVGRSGGSLRGGGNLPGEDTFAQVLTPNGHVFGATTAPLSHSPLLTPQELRDATTMPIRVDRADVEALEGPARLFARPLVTPDRTLVVLVGASLDDRNGALDNLRKILLIGGPVALLLASLAGYAVAVGALRPVEAMRRRAAAISAAEPDQRLPVPETDDEIARLGETLNAMLGRLEAALERERTFVDDASHELRTPLALHKTELELALRYAKTPDEMRAAISSAIVEVDRLSALAEDLLVLARSEQGKLALHLRTVHVADLLGDVRERFAARIDGSGRSLVVEPPNGLTVDGDPVRLEQALTNLIENAIQHGSGEITVRASEFDGDLQIHVEDRGPGFPPEFIDRAFERFRRADRARGGDGTGLGLAIVEAIARAHRGSAHAANRDGSGADVWIELPADPQ
jgi:two-component system, OmpR family, sensor kinase